VTAVRGQEEGIQEEILCQLTVGKPVIFKAKGTYGPRVQIGIKGQ
jgi:hypothetical protein